MILNQLVQLYDRLEADAAENLPRYGWSIERVSFAIRITKDGQFRGFSDLRDENGKSVPMAVPAHATRSSGICPFFLCDSSTYLLGCDTKGKPERAMECFKQSVALHRRLAEQAQEGSVLAAVGAFFSNWSPEQPPDTDYFEDATSGGFLVFQVDGETRFAHEDSGCRDSWDASIKAEDSEIETGACLVTGELAPLQRVHSSIGGVRGAQSSGAAIVSFNFDSATSFGKEQGANAPVSRSAAFRYSAALNRLLSSRKNRVVVDDLTIVFWSQSPTPFETMFGFAIGGATAKETDERVAVSLQAIKNGTPSSELDLENVFYVLGLGANASRVVIRFWLTGTVGQFARNLGQHLRDFELEQEQATKGGHLPIWLIVRECRRRYTGSGKDRRAIDPDPHPGLSKSLLRAVLYGGAYPQALFASAIARIRADGEVNRPRVATIKGFLARTYRNRNKEVPMALDEDFANVGYQLGRLFSALEKAQRDALGNINATIKDRYFGAASATPRRVFPLLIRLSQHHIAKAEWGHAADKRIEEIMQHIGEFPVHLSLEDQGFFALGYYHQRNALFAKKDTTRETADE